MKKAIILFFCVFIAVTSQADSPARSEIKLPGMPFDVVTTSNQDWIFVSMGGENATGIGVLKNDGSRIDFARLHPMKIMPAGIVLTHKEDILIVTTPQLVIFYDVDRLRAGQTNAAFQLVSDGARAGSVYANITSDDKTLFVSDEMIQNITVIDMDKIRSFGRDSAANIQRARTGPGAQEAIIGRIRVGVSPVALTFSKDEHWLFSTSQIAPESWNWPSILSGEIGQTKVPEGAVVVIDVAKARTDSKNAVVARAPSGGSPVRLALAPDGQRLFAVARNSDAMLTFDTDTLIKNGDKAKPIKTPVGSDPVPVVLVDDGKLALVGNTDRYGSNSTNNSTLTVIETKRIGTAQNPVLGKIACGAFPREFHLSADGKKLYLTNFRSQSLLVFDVPRIRELIEK